MGTLHLITPEYPPVPGGVASYTRVVARGLRDAGESVHVWCPPGATLDSADRLHVHPECGAFGAADLERLGRLLDEFAHPRRLLVQWVPHGYGQRAMNMQFCTWLWRRARRGDRIELMVHEAYLAFWEGSWRQTAAALMHRAMTIVLLQAASRVWMAIPAWESRWRPYTLGRDVPFAWLPVPSALPQPEAAAIDRVRQQCGGKHLIGHLGTYGSLIAGPLESILCPTLERVDSARVVLLGSASDRFHREFSIRHPHLAARVAATGHLPERDLSAHVAACDLLVQPYPDGISSRRTTAMAGLRLGVPVVTTIGALTEPFWETSQAVRLSRPGDSTGAVHHIEELLNHPDARRRLGDAGRAFYDQMFDLRRTLIALTSAA